MKYTVNRASGQSAYIQIYRQLRDDIVAGRLKDGAKLPSKRFAAAELGVSVITVEHAYELLEEVLTKTQKQQAFVKESAAGTMCASAAPLRRCCAPHRRSSGRTRRAISRFPCLRVRCAAS